MKRTIYNIIKKIDKKLKEMMTYTVNIDTSDVNVKLDYSRVRFFNKYEAAAYATGVADVLTSYGEVYYKVDIKKKQIDIECERRFDEATE